MDLLKTNFPTTYTLMRFITLILKNFPEKVPKVLLVILVFPDTSLLATTMQTY